MKKNINNKNAKYITGSVAALAMSVAACAAGVDARNTQSADAGQKYDAGTVSNETELATEAADDTTEGMEEETEDTTDTVSDDELVDKLTSSVDVSDKDITKDETVYVFADPSGKTTDILVNEVLKNTDGSATLTDKTDLTDIENVKGDEEYTVDGDTITWQANGNDITYQGKTSKSLPVDVAVTYYLDGNEVKPEELAGKSGKVKIRFDYTNNETVVKDVNGRDEDINVPFVAVTGMVLGDNFSNVTVTNGRSVSQGDSSIVIGFGMPGFMDSIKATSDDFAEDVDVPDYFEVEADVTDFSLDMTATVVVDGSAMNISGELDVSSLDEMMDSLSDATAQLVDGSGELSDGVATLLEKMGEFDTGVGTLKAGIDSLASGSTTLINGIETIDASAQSISNGIAALDTALNTPMTDSAKSTTYNTAYNAAKSQAASAASISVSDQMKEGTDTYNQIKDGVSSKLSGSLTDKTAQSTAASEVLKNVVADPRVSGAPGALSDSVKSTVEEAIQEAYKQGVADGAKAGVVKGAEEQATTDRTNSIISADNASNYTADITGMGYTTPDAVKTTISTTISTTMNKAVSDIVTNTTGGVMDYIAKTYSESLGKSVAETCQSVAAQAAGQAAGEAAGEAAGQAAVQGAETAKSQIAAQIEAKQANGYSLVTGAKALAEGTNAMDKAAPALTDGIAALKEGANTLADGSSQLVDGVSTLNDGALTLKDGMQTYDTEAISKIVNSYNGDIKSLVERLSAVASASSEYDTFTMHEDGVGATTKFIIKTAGIEAAE